MDGIKNKDKQKMEGLYTEILSCKHIWTHAQQYTQNTHPSICIKTHKHTRIQNAHKHTYMQIKTQTNTHTHTDIYTHIHKHTPTHTYIYK